MARDFEDHCWEDVVSPEILKVYEPYRRDVYVGDRPALLAIDLYNFVYRGDPTKYPHELCDEFPNSWRAVTSIDNIVYLAHNDLLMKKDLKDMETKAIGASDLMNTRTKNATMLANHDGKVYAMTQTGIHCIDPSNGNAEDCVFEGGWVRVGEL